MLGALIGPANVSGDDRVIAGLAWGDESALVISRLREMCRDLDIVKPERVQFPLSRYSERHVSCRGMQLPTGEASAAVFVVADDALTMIEARGGAVRALAGERIDAASTFLSYRVLDEGRLFADLEADTVWLLSEDALHLHLFMWSNTHLSRQDDAPPVYETSAKLPTFIAFGADLESTKALLEGGVCSIMASKTIEEVWLPHGPETQTQID